MTPLRGGVGFVFIGVTFPVIDRLRGVIEVQLDALVDQPFLVTGEVLTSPRRVGVR